MKWLAGAVLLSALGGGAAQAEPDAADYQVERTVPAGRAREQLEADIARDVEQEARRAQHEAAQQALQRAQADAEEARRPYPQRLLQARCTLCHSADNYLNRRHTLLGWHLVILRMRAFNRAPLALDEHAVLAAELARVRPAAGVDALVEVALGTGAVALPLAAPWWLGWRLRRRRSSPSRPARERQRSG
jgi:hypothetical protein